MINIDQDIAQEACIWFINLKQAEIQEYIKKFPVQALITVSLTALTMHPHVITGAVLLFRMLELQEERNKTKELSELFKLEDKRV